MYGFPLELQRLNSDLEEETRRRKENLMARYLLGLLFALLLFSDPIATAAPPPSASSSLFVLGDSTANCRDINLFPSQLWPNFSLPSCSNRLLADFIAEKMGLSPPPPFHTLKGSSSFTASVWNFGTPQGTILSSTNSFSSPTLCRQVRLVEEALQFLQLQYGPITAPLAASSALFLLSFGTDDYMQILKRQSEVNSHPKIRRHKLAPLLVSHMVRAIKSLYYADARRIAVIGLGPIGCVPHVVLHRSRSVRLDIKHCIVEVNDLIKGYNVMLETRLESLRSELPSAEILFCDVYKGILEIISNPKNYGLENVQDPCCRVGQLSGVPCMAEDMACLEPHRHVWWDLYSTTQVVNSLLADWLWSNSSSVSICRPVPLQNLA